MSGKRLWLAAWCALVLVAGLVMLPVGSSPAAAQTAETGFNWLAFYWNNTNFQGSPALSRTDPVVNFNWGANAPAPGINADNFSVRWSNRITFGAGTFRFRAGADDGIRVAVNGQIIIDRFTPSSEFIVNTADVTLGAGTYEIIVDYFEGTGNAGVLFDWTNITGGAPATFAPGVGTPAPTFGPTPTTVPAVKGVVIVNRANVRTGPGMQYPVFTQVARDQVFFIQARDCDCGFETWFLVDLGGGAKGWIARRVMLAYNGDPASLPYSKELIDSPVVEQDPGGQGTPVAPFEVQGVARNNAIVRSAPSQFTGEPIGVIDAGQTFRILKLSTSQAWVLVDFNGLQGWTFVPNVRVVVGSFAILPRGD